MLEIEIDGKQVQVPDGSTVIEAATKAGSYIPHFCYHKKLSIAASCRMCLVQVEKAPKPLPACATPVTNGMKVWTHSENAVKAQKGVMEFLLINHPLDCPICDQGGECQLQDLAVGYGGVKSRYEEEKRVVADKDLGPLVSTDMTRCINCTRCVRFTTEIAGFMELGQAFRGEHAEIMPFVEKTVDTELSGNIIDLCPVGALTSKPFRFSARTWELSRRKSVAPHDSIGSNLIVQVKHDVVKRVLPFENDEVNECWLSDRDRFSYEGLQAEDRLLAPMVKRNGQWQQTDWQTALEAAASALKGVVAGQGGDALAALGAPQSTVEELFLLQKLARGLGSENIDSRLRQIDFRTDGLTDGAPNLGMALKDVAELDRLLVVGSYLRKDVPLLAQRVRQAAKRGLQVSAIGNASEDWALKLRNRVVVKPSALAATLAQVLKAVAGAKGAAVADAVASVQVSGEAQAVADSLLSGRKVALWIGSQVELGPQRAEVHALVQGLAELLGASFGFIGTAANSVGAHLAGAVPTRGGNVAALLDAPRKAYLLLGVEPEFDFASARKALAALKQAEAVVALAAFKSPALLDVAQVLLPVTPYAETSGTFVNAEGRVQSFHAVTKPRGDARPAWKVLRVLGNLLNLGGFDYADSRQVADEALAGAAAKLGNTTRFSVSALPAVGSAIERVADVPIYRSDALVRRAPALQVTADGRAPAVRAAAVTLAELGIAAGGRVRIADGIGSLEASVALDDSVAPGCVHVAAACAEAAVLGNPYGQITVERL